MNNSEETNNYIYYIVPILFLILGLGLGFLYFYKKYKTGIIQSPIIPSPTGPSPTGPNTIYNTEQKKLQYKKNIIDSINKYNGIVVKENFVNFNDIHDTSDPSMIDYDCNGRFPGKGKINDNSKIPCSKVFNPFFEGDFNIKCNSDKKWEVTDFNCKSKGLTDKKDLTGKWKTILLTDDERSGNKPINYERDLTDEEKQNERNYTTFKSFDMNTEKGILFGDGRDIDYEYIKDIGYTVGKLFPVGMTFVNNNYDNIVGSHFFLKKI